MASSNEPLRKYDVGSYGDLSSRPNPEAFVVLRVPSFEDILPFLEQKAGRKLAADEISAEQQRAPSIALPKDEAERMAAAQTARRR